MKKVGTSTLAIDKAIQNFFNSKCECENPPPMFAFIQDASVQESYESANLAVARLKSEHGIIAEVVTKPAGIYIYESEELENCDDGDQDNNQGDAPDGPRDDEDQGDAPDGPRDDEDQGDAPDGPIDDEDQGDDTCAIKSFEVVAEGHVDEGNPDLDALKRLMPSEPENIEDDDTDAKDPGAELDKIEVKPLGEEKPSGELIEIEDLIKTSVTAKAVKRKKN